jgi:quercetin dioxygenase-like cupin family protein
MTIMPYPECIKKLPKVKVAFPGVQGWVSQGKESQVVFFEIEAGGVVSPHSHCEQFGIVLEGEMALTMNGATKVYKKGDSYHIPEGIVHKAEFKTFVRAVDFFAGPNRYETERT